MIVPGSLHRLPRGLSQWPDDGNETPPRTTPSLSRGRPARLTGGPMAQQPPKPKPVPEPEPPMPPPPPEPPEPPEPRPSRS